MQALAEPLVHRSDDELMQRIREGDTDDALPALRERYARDVRRVVQAVVREPSLADDVATEALEKIWIQRARYQPGTNFRAWLLGVARNHALTALRAHKRAARMGAAAGSDMDSTGLDQRAVVHDEEPGQHELTHAMTRAVADLPDRYRTVFEMCVEQRQPYTEVSRQLQLPRGTVAIRVRRARQRLFSGLARHLEPAQVTALTRHYATCA